MKSFDIKDALFQHLVEFCKENNLSAGGYKNLPWIVTIPATPLEMSMMIIDLNTREYWTNSGRGNFFEFGDPNLVPFLKDIIMKRMVPE